MRTDVSKTYTTGALIARTAFHSVQFNGKIENNVCKNGIYRMAKWRVIDRMMAYTSIILFQRGKARSDSLDESAFMAFNISITTRIESDTVDADSDISLENISQPISGN